MIPVLIETAFRSLFVGSANASIVLPAHTMTLLEELQTRIQAKSESGGLPRPVAVPNPMADSLQTEWSSGPALDSTLTPGTNELGPSNTQPASAPAESVADSARAGGMQPFRQLSGVAARHRL